MADLNSIAALKMQARLKLADRLKKLYNMGDTKASNSSRALLDRLTKEYGTTAAKQKALFQKVTQDTDAIINKFASEPSGSAVSKVVKPAKDKPAATRGRNRKTPTQPSTSTTPATPPTPPAPTEVQVAATPPAQPGQASATKPRKSAVQRVKKPKTPNTASIADVAKPAKDKPAATRGRNRKPSTSSSVPSSPIQVEARRKIKSTLPTSVQPLVDAAILEGEARDIAEARKLGIMTNEEVAAARKKAGWFVPIDELNEQHKKANLAAGAKNRPSVQSQAPTEVQVAATPPAQPGQASATKPRKSAVQRVKKPKVAAEPAASKAIVLRPKPVATLTTERGAVPMTGDDEAIRAGSSSWWRNRLPPAPVQGDVIEVGPAPSRDLVARTAAPSRPRKSVRSRIMQTDAAVDAARVAGATNAAVGAADVAAAAGGRGSLGAARPASMLRKLKGSWRLAGTLGKVGLIGTGVGAALTAAELASYGYGLLRGNQREGTVEGLEQLAGYQENTRQEEELRQAETMNRNLRRIDSDAELMMSRVMNEQDQRMSDLATLILKNEGAIRAAAVPSSPSFAEVYASMGGTR